MVGRAAQDTVVEVFAGEPSSSPPAVERLGQPERLSADGGQRFFEECPQALPPARGGVGG